MAADVKRSEFNPFRSPAVTPNPTGSGPSTSTSNNIPTPSMPQSQLSTSSADPSRNETSPPRMERSPADDLAAELEATALDDNASSEPPPAYTPAANPYEGEATVEYGPRRPFQPAPPPPPLPQQFTGISQGGYFVSPQVTGLPMVANQTGGWAHYPGQGVRGSGPAVNICPPPQHPSMRVRGSDPGLRVSSASTPHRPLSEFARDFYAATLNDGRALSPTPSDVSSGETPDPEHSERMCPTVNTSSSYAPPPGPPPPRHPPPSGPPPSSPTSPGASSPTSLHGPPGGPPQSRPPRVVSNNADDWKPTNTPTPGRPLLNKGRVLMYPSGYECRKCLNTGYKNFDPSHPCKKCWEKYAKPYSGAIIYAPRSQQSQKPLPSFRPPHLRHQQSQSQPSLLYPPPPSSNLSRSQSVYRPSSSTSPVSGGYPVSPVSNPGAGGSVPPPPQPMQTPRPQLSFTRGMPPPGSTIVQPGDARIGGRLCWRCGGDGTVSFLIFDVERCPICNGLGRTFQ